LNQYRIEQHLFWMQGPWRLRSGGLTKLHQRWSVVRFAACSRWGIFSTTVHTKDKCWTLYKCYYDARPTRSKAEQWFAAEVYSVSHAIAKSPCNL